MKQQGCMYYYKNLNYKLIKSGFFFWGGGGWSSVELSQKFYYEYIRYILAYKSFVDKSNEKKYVTNFKKNPLIYMKEWGFTVLKREKGISETQIFIPAFMWNSKYNLTISIIKSQIKSPSMYLPIYWWTFKHYVVLLHTLLYSDRSWVLKSALEWFCVLKSTFEYFRMLLGTFKHYLNFSILAYSLI
jgi:hypothetical protein